MLQLLYLENICHFGQLLLQTQGPKICLFKARLHWRFYLDENVSVLATVSMFVVMDVYDSHGKQIHQPWDTLGRCGLKNRKSSIFSKRYAQGTSITLIIL